MSSILKGLNEGRSYGRDSWDSNMPGYQGDYGGAENFGRRNREWDEDDRIDARIRAEYEKKKEYEQNGKFWLKLKDSQRHLPAGPFIGKQAANTAAVELLKQQPELKGNLVITAYGPDETQGVAEAELDELSNNTLASYKKKAGADATQADKRGDYARGNKRMGGIIKATKKEFDNDAKGLAEAGNKPLEKSRFGTGDTRTPRDIKSQMQGASDEFVKSTADSKTGPFHSRVAKMQSKLAQSELRRREQGVAEGSGFDKWADDRAASQLYKLKPATEWTVSFDYGPHMSKTVTVKAGSEDEAIAKVEKAAEKKGMSIMINSVEQGVVEEKQRLDPSCWKGYKKQGTKMKGDTRVNNCVPVKKESAIMKGLVDEDSQGDK